MSGPHISERVVFFMGRVRGVGAPLTLSEREAYPRRLQGSCQAKGRFWATRRSAY